MDLACTREVAASVLDQRPSGVCQVFCFQSLQVYVGTVSEIRPRDLSTYLHSLPSDEVTDHVIRYSMLDCLKLQMSIAYTNNVEKGKKENEERGRGVEDKRRQVDHYEENRSQGSEEDEEEDVEEIAWIIIIITAAGVGGRRGTAWRLLYCYLYSNICSHTTWSVGHAVSYPANITCPVMLTVLLSYGLKTRRNMVKNVR